MSQGVSMFRSKLAFAAVAAVVTLHAGAGYAQTSKGILTGSARDQTGAVLSGATVTVRNQSTGQVRTVTTKSDGAYRVEAIDPGSYTITVSQAGFGLRYSSSVVRRQRPFGFVASRQKL